MSVVRTLIVLGTRPEAIKLAPVIQRCRERSAEISTVVCSTGQHKEMLAQVVEYFGLRVDRDLLLMQPNQSLANFAARGLTALDGVLREVEPECVVAQGDTTTVLCAALASFYQRKAFVHVEAGLRTGDLQAPWPEEMNRRVASLLTGVHCCPTETSAENLRREGVSERAIHVTGNTVIDALLQTAARERAASSRWEAKYPFLSGRKMVLITGHRRESFGDGFQRICRAIAALARSFPQVAWLYPVHLNPQVRQPVHDLLGGLANVYLTEPAPYSEFVWLMDRAELILTDSGGVQEEAPSLRKPVLVMRDVTERPEAVAAGATELVGTDDARIVARATLLLTSPQEYRARQIERNPYGDGRAAERIAELIATRAWRA